MFSKSVWVFQKGGVIMQTSVEIKINKEEIKEMMAQEIKKTMNQTFWLVDINRLSELTSMSRGFLENEIICDPRMKVIERKRSRKRWWSYPEAMKAIQEITSEW